jgi:cytochrome c biogenesis protein CcdA/thiol-disulfide isomerase/thioredoxin
MLGDLMLVLTLFAFLAGVATVLSPCVLPVLPALLAAGAGNGRLRPLGVVCGVIASFTFFTLALAALVKLFGISPDFLRSIAIAVIAAFGIVLIFPSLGLFFAKSSGRIASLGAAIESKSRSVSSGFWSGAVLGSALGLVWTPCAGPILAAITTLVATSSVSWEALAITLAYSLGAALPMFVIIYGGKKVISASRVLSSHTEGIRQAFGAFMVGAALAIALHYDVKFQEAAVAYLPLINLDDNSLVREELQKLRSKSSLTNEQFILPSAAVGTKLHSSQGEQAPNAAPALPELAVAPQLVGIVDWVNSAPLNLGQLRGKVVLIDFWTYSCINCIRTFPYLKDLDDKYRDKGLVIVGVHTPEFEFEKNPENVKMAVERFGLHYPVAIDSDFKTWQNYNNQYWPAHYLIDQKGIVRSFHFGEGAYRETENEIRNLLGLTALAGSDVPQQHRFITPETYLGSLRGNSYTPDNKIVAEKKTLYDYSGKLESDLVGLRGSWLVLPEKIAASDGISTLDLNFAATRVYLVMDAPQLQLVTVLLDGKPLPKEYATADMNDQGQIKVKEPRKYDVLNLHRAYGRHLLTLQLPEGVELYAFTFGDEP